MNLNGNALTVTGSGTTTFDGNTANIISGSGGIVKSGTGSLILDGGQNISHTFTGGITITGGAVRFQTAANVSGRGNVSINGGSILANAGFNSVATRGVTMTDVGDIFSLINYTGAWNTGRFSIGANVLDDEEIFTLGLNTWRISYDDATGGSNFSGAYFGGSDSFVNLHAVIPEPRAALLGALGALLLLLRRR